VEAGGGKLGLVSQQVAGLVNRGGANGPGTFQAGALTKKFFILDIRGSDPDLVAYRQKS
jgi:hypothetical protein